MPKNNGNSSENDIINAVVDLSHHNGAVDLEKAKEDGIIGVIHKATQGLAYVDPDYSINRQKALDAGILWGAYHFGTGGDGLKQADHFLDVVGTDPGVLPALDFEPNPQGTNMSLEEAHDFIERIVKVTGRYPGFYSGHYIKELLGNKKDPLLERCWLWLAQYGPKATVPPAWSSWTLWQYTDGTIGPEPHTIQGIGRCDRDKFNGNEESLRKLWQG